MVLSQFLLDTQKRDSSISTVWLLATLGYRSSYKRLPKREIASVSIPDVCDTISQKIEPVNSLKISSNLLYGVAITYKQKINYFFLETKSLKREIQKKKLKRTNYDTHDNVLPIMNLFNNSRPSTSIENWVINKEFKVPKVRKSANISFLRDDDNFDIRRGLLGSRLSLYLGTETSEIEDARRQIKEFDLENDVTASIIGATSSIGDSHAKNFQHANVHYEEENKDPRYSKLFNNDLINNEGIFEVDNELQLDFGEDINKENLTPSQENLKELDELEQANQSPPPKQNNDILDFNNFEDGIVPQVGNFLDDGNLQDISNALPIEPEVDQPPATTTNPQIQRKKILRSGYGGRRKIEYDEYTELHSTDLNRTIYFEKTEIKRQSFKRTRDESFETYKKFTRTITGKYVSIDDLSLISFDQPFFKLLKKLETLNKDTSSQEKREIEVYRNDIETGRDRISRSQSPSKLSINGLFTPSKDQPMNDPVYYGIPGDDNLDFGPEENANIEPISILASTPDKNLEEEEEEEEDWFLNYSGLPLELEEDETPGLKRRRTATPDQRLKRILFGNKKNISNSNNISPTPRSRTRSLSKGSRTGSNPFENDILFEVSREDETIINNGPNQLLLKNLDPQSKRLLKFLNLEFDNQPDNPSTNPYDKNNIPRDLSIRFKNRINLGNNLVKLSFEQIVNSKFSEDLNPNLKSCSRSIAASMFLGILQLATKSLVDIESEELIDNYYPCQPKDLNIFFNH